MSFRRKQGGTASTGSSNNFEYTEVRSSDAEEQDDGGGFVVEAIAVDCETNDPPAIVVAAPADGQASVKDTGIHSWDVASNIGGTGGIRVFDHDDQAVCCYAFAKRCVLVYFLVGLLPMWIVLCVPHYDFVVKSITGYVNVIAVCLLLPLVPFPVRMIMTVINKISGGGGGGSDHLKSKTYLSYSDNGTTITSIGHIQPRDPNSNVPTGGEFCIPLTDIPDDADVFVTVTPALFGFAVTTVTIATKDRPGSYIVKGHPSDSTYVTLVNSTARPSKHHFIFYGLTDPYEFRTMINDAKKSNVVV